jgi:thiamine-phosphate pyrophosphorylase
MSRDASIRGLYIITPDDPDFDSVLERTASAIDGGARVVQFRRKVSDRRGRLREASRMAVLCREHGAIFIVNDDPRLAAEVCADGVHLGRDDGTVADARRVIGEGGLVGVSCYDQLDLAIAGARAGADYVAFGSFYPSTVKPGAVRPPLTLLTDARAVVSCPIVAIGGITLARAANLVFAGADATAVISDIFRADDVRARAMGYARLFEPTRRQN